MSKYTPTSSGDYIVDFELMEKLGGYSKGYLEAIKKHTKTEDGSLLVKKLYKAI